MNNKRKEALGGKSEAHTFQRLELKAHRLHLHLAVRERARRCETRNDSGDRFWCSKKSAPNRRSSRARTSGGAVARFEKDAELSVLQHRSGAPLARLLADQHSESGNAKKNVLSSMNSDPGKAWAQ